jgi:hypothetical protein
MQTKIFNKIIMDYGLEIDLKNFRYLLGSLTIR